MHGQPNIHIYMCYYVYLHVDFKLLLKMYYSAILLWAPIKYINTEDIMDICQVVDTDGVHRCLDSKKNKFYFKTS